MKRLVSDHDLEIFENLFVLEAANNHWGNFERGKKIVQTYGNIVRVNSVRAAIKFQFRDVDNFIHPDFKGNQDIRYIKKTEATRMSKQNFEDLAILVRNVGCIPMATPFDEASVELCVDLEFPIIKVASSDINDWPLIEKIASTKKPVIISSGGASEKSLDDVVTFFERRNISLAINHCVSLYPSEDYQLHLNEIDFLQRKYKKHVIGFSSHEYGDWSSSMLISYAKGARTWERHIDIELDDIPVSKYCSLPEQIDTWFKTFHKAKEMCGVQTDERRNISKEEIRYLDALVRGVYAKRNIPKGLVINNANFTTYFTLNVPLQKGQLSTREIINGLTITRDVEVGDPITIDCIDGPYGTIPELRAKIVERGV